jgi:hypothetical protein
LDNKTPTAFRVQERLGPPLREHRPRRGSQRGYTVAGWLLLAIGLGAGLLAAGRGLFAYETFGPLAVERWAAPPAYASAILLAVGLGLLWLGRGPSRMVVRQHARGLAIERGRRGSAIPWDDIKHVYTSSVRYGPGPLALGHQEELVLVTRDGRRYRLRQALDDFDELVTAVKRGAYPTLLDTYTRAFNQAQSIAFGPLQLAPEGIHNGRKVLSWNQVGQARLERGWLVVDPSDAKAGPRLRFPARAVPNVDVCLQLIQELTSHR